MRKQNLKAIPKCWWSFGSITWVIAAKLLSCASTPTELELKQIRIRTKLKQEHILWGTGIKIRTKFSTQSKPFCIVGDI